jgi:hypothetical protein
MKLFVLTVSIFTMMLLVAPIAQAHLIKPFKGTAAQKYEAAKINLAHARGACKAHKRVAQGRDPMSHCSAIAWLRAVMSRHAPLTIKEYVRRHHPCLYTIIERENGRWDPTIDFGWGHGNVYEAYGIPQANPGTKMASAGHDWKTNPWTQLRWMIGYVNGRYGGECEALAHHNKYGQY